MTLKENLKDLLHSLINKPYVDQYVLNEFLIRSNRDDLIKFDNFTDHFCTFFLPIHIPSRSLYLVHHIKADDWIPPGGHIDKNELPLNTIKREFNEELSFRLTHEPINFFNISIKHIVNNPRNTCKVHYDLWFTVTMKEQYDFSFLKKEFHDAKWTAIDDAIGKSHYPHINAIYQKMKSYLFTT